MTGQVDNAGDPAITVAIDMAVTMPAHAKGKVPVIIQFGSVVPQTFPGLPPRPPEPGPDWRAQILSRGWGYVVLDPTTVQADNGAGLNAGIIGLVNKGRSRKMDDWGALRAWAWGASRAVDYLKTQPHVAGDEIGIQGHSRYGKAALVAMAYDPRIAIGFISSSGAGGAKLFHHYFGETLENVAAANEFHWMAGNFLKYAADPMSVKDLPVDMDALVALCAPRPVFIGAGASAQGDAWVDARGMFLSAAGATPVYKLLGQDGVGVAGPAADAHPALSPARSDFASMTRPYAGAQTGRRFSVLRSTIWRCATRDKDRAGSDGCTRNRGCRLPVRSSVADSPGREACACRPG